MGTQNWKKRGWWVVALVWLSEWSFAQSLERFSFAEPHLGTIVELTIYAPDQTVANEAARTAFARVKQLDRIFSDYKPDSEAMRLCDEAGTGRAIKVSSELFTVLKAAVTVSEQTDGAFDVTVGTLVQLWRRARKEKRLPTSNQIVVAKELVGWKLVVLNELEQSVELKRAGMRLDFGGIAKGFIAQDVSRLLRERGFERTLVAVAGDIVAGDSPPSADGWKVAVAPLRGVDKAPSRLLLLKHRAISTSGDAFQFVEIDGVRYSHIVDPKTGLGLTRRSSVTIVADDGIIADALATAICVIGPGRGMTLIEENPSLAALIVQANDDGVELIESKGFRLHEVK
jgi:thiamine biosynthesis lipoprotein